MIFGLRTFEQVEFHKPRDLVEVGMSQRMLKKGERRCSP